MDDGTRVALRALAQRAEWGSGTGQGGAEAEASRLRELGRALAGRLAGDLDDSTWAHRAVAELADCCQGADAAWSGEDVARLARLREAADIALAPGPGQPDPDPRPARPRKLSPPSLLPTRLASLPRGRRAVALGLAVVGCALVAGIVLASVGGGGHNDNSGSGTGSNTGSSAGSGTGSAAPTVTATAEASTGLGTGPVGTDSASGPSGASTTPANGAKVTAIQMTATPASDYPEVQVYGTITTSGTGDVTVTVTVAGVSGGTPQVSTEDESSQTSYALSQTIYLQQWCGQKSVTVTVSSGAVSKSATVPVSGC